MITIEQLQDQPREFIDRAIHFYWSQWGTGQNQAFYRDCIDHSLTAAIDVPKFYVALDGEKFVGMCALLRNDLISRQDLCPWLACLFVDPAYRGQQLGSRLMEHVQKEAAARGYKEIYLSTSLNDFYERYGWTYEGIGYYSYGGKTKIYTKRLES